MPEKCLFAKPEPERGRPCPCGCGRLVAYLGAPNGSSPARAYVDGRGRVLFTTDEQA